MLSGERRAQALPHRWDRPLRRLVGVILALLLIQFLLGMILNLYVKLPKVHPGTESTSFLQRIVEGLGWAITSGDLALAAHSALGMLILLISLCLLGLAIAARRAAWLVLAVVGVGAIVGAGLNGNGFLNQGGQDSDSMQMSIGFAVATAVYAVGLYAARQS
jgi:quinol-cytochrome oxidoreductase complex cytochrome b subunit